MGNYRPKAKQRGGGVGRIVIPPALPFSGFMPAIAMHHTPPWELEARQVDSSLAVHHKFPKPTRRAQLSEQNGRVLAVADRPNESCRSAPAGVIGKVLYREAEATRQRALIWTPWRPTALPAKGVAVDVGVDIGRVR